MARAASYVICTAPRSGSTLLCELLTTTGLAGAPDSHFHEPSLAAWLDDFGLAPDPDLTERELLQAVFRAARLRGRGETDVFGLRLQRFSFDFLMTRLSRLHPGANGDVERVEAEFGPTRFIFLKREDKVAQAVSFVKARQSGLWHRAEDGTEIERLAPPGEPTYDADALRSAYEMFLSFDREWEDWFSASNLHPMRLSYEALAHDPQKAVCNVLGVLGITEKGAADAKPRVAKLADEVNLEWTARFKRDLLNA